MRKYLIVLTLIAIAAALAIVFRSQLRKTAQTEPPLLPQVVVSQPSERVPPATVIADTSPTGAVASPPGQQPPTKPAAQTPGIETATPKKPIGTVSPSGEVAPIEPEQSADGAALLKNASAAYARLSSFKADFSQWQENPLLGKRTTSRGTVYQRRPDRFAMKFSQPAGDLIIGDGQYFWMFYPSYDSKQVLRTRAGNTGGLDLQSQFVGDPTRRFNYTMQGTEAVAGRPARVFMLIPKTDAGYKSLKVWIDEKDFLVRRFELTSENGAVQHFDLTNFEANPTIADQVFRFSPPAGVRIVER